MINLQLAEKPVANPEAIDFVDVFSTIQGEGPFAGEPAIFVRLAGCNLACPACDTDYTSKRRSLPPAELVTLICEYREQTCIGANLIVITGGEPFRQSCGKLTRFLIDEGFRIQFETNGTIYDPSMADYWQYVTVICSPKTPSINEKLAPHISHYKYVLQSGRIDERDGLPTETMSAYDPERGHLCGHRPARPHKGHRGKIYVQPLDEGCSYGLSPTLTRDEISRRNAVNTTACVIVAQRFGYTVSVQLHKIIGLP